MFEAVLEVIDTRSGALLVSYRVPGEQAQLSLPREMFRGSRLGYRVAEGEDGLPVVVIVAVDPVKR